MHQICTNFTSMFHTLGCTLCDRLQTQAFFIDVSCTRECNFGALILFLHSLTCVFVLKRSCACSRQRMPVHRSLLDPLLRCVTLVLCTCNEDVKDVILKSYYLFDCDSITFMGGARIYCFYLSRFYDDQGCCEGRVERSVVARLRLKHIISFHERRSIHSYKMLLTLLFNVKAFESFHLTRQLHVWIIHV